MQGVFFFFFLEKRAIIIIDNWPTKSNSWFMGEGERYLLPKFPQNQKSMHLLWVYVSCNNLTYKA